MPIAVLGQDTTRIEQIEAAQKKKAQSLEPDEPGRVEQSFIRTQKVLDRFSSGLNGVRIKLGGLVSGSGFAIGPEYMREDLWNDQLTLRASARVSFRGYQLYDLQATLPHLNRDHVWVDVLAQHRNYSSLAYYGPGPTSQKSGRTDYRLEDTSLDANAGFKPMRDLRLGASAGYVAVNVGPGTDERYASTDRVYPPVLAPGIDRQSNFFRGGPFVQYDTRDSRGDPHAGGNYFAQYTVYRDVKLESSDFRRLDLEAQQYIHFLNLSHVIALRGRAQFTYPESGDFVPFYLQPTLGGSDDLRGFHPLRFHGDNAFLMTAEYRYQIFRGFDVALFADSGKVVDRPLDLDFAHLEIDGGFGFRIKTRSSVAVRLDTGFSREGFQVWFKFGNVF